MTRLSFLCLGSAVVAMLQYSLTRDSGYASVALLLIGGAAYFYKPPDAPLYQITLNQPMTFPRVSYTELATPGAN